MMRKIVVPKGSLNLVTSCLLLVAGCDFYSCIIVNNCRGESNICEVHHKKMKRVVVGTDFGLSAYSYTESPHAKEKENMGCEVQPWPIERLAIIYHCPICDSIRNLKK